MRPVGPQPLLHIWMPEWICSPSFCFPRPLRLLLPLLPLTQSQFSFQSVRSASSVHTSVRIPCLSSSAMQAVLPWCRTLGAMDPAQYGLEMMDSAEVRRRRGTLLLVFTFFIFSVYSHHSEINTICSAKPLSCVHKCFLFVYALH